MKALPLKHSSNSTVHSSRPNTRDWKAFFFLQACLLSLVLSLSTFGSTLEQDFLHPPASARPWVYWFWLNGNITSNGITADLEAMQRVGIGGVLIMEVDQGAPKGPADFGSPAWRALFQHVCAEAHRLGLEVNMNNDAGWCGSGGPWITPDLAMQKVVWFETNIQGPIRFDADLAQPKTLFNYYRDIAVLAFPTPAQGARIDKLEAKAAFVPDHLAVTGTFAPVPVDQTVPQQSIVNLSGQSSPGGHLVWDVPPGKWTVLRLGHTALSTDNHPAPDPGRGLESDKLSKQATGVMFNGLMAKLIADSKPLAGRTLVSTHIDSWETGSQNWTPLFREEFKRLRGYDPLLLLPVLTGRVVESAEVSERFLWDVRQTVSQLLVENYAGEFRRLANQQGLRLSIEAYDGTPCDDLSYAGQADEPMAEFWSWGNNTAYSCVEMSSAAHVYGKRILGAEAFTATDGEKWLLHPGVLKTLGDWAFCEGINRFVFHRYALQPWLDRAPGMSMGPWGLHYERTETWWEQSASWHEYLSRCQYLLRQGLCVADICFLEPEGSPMRFTPTMPWRTGDTPDRPRYQFDGCPPEVVLTRMKVKDGRLVLPDGMSYRLLVLPQVETMTPALLRKVQELVKAGATVVGPPPRKSPSLSGYPKCDEQVRQLAGQTWGDATLAATIKSPRKTVLWTRKFETTAEPGNGKSPLQSAQWIWQREGNPAVAAPPGARYFRRVFEVPNRVASARVVMTADNSFELWVNGQSAGRGDNFNQSYTMEVGSLLKMGTNILAVTAINGADSPNPAGLIGSLRIDLTDGRRLEIKTDSQWQSATNVGPSWTSQIAADASWTPAMELGPLGMQPWGELDKPSAAPYVYPDFSAIAGLLKSIGVEPDFDADSRLRFIHRRAGDTDIYFVANSQTNWLQANCAFRVSGKQPELWDPLTGRVERPALYEERNGRTFLCLALEPAGSTFVVFRNADKSAGAEGAPNQFVDVVRDNTNVLPAPGRPVQEPPCLDLQLGRTGHLDGIAFQPGHYELRGAYGQRRSFTIAPLPAPVRINGPWEVQFQANRGAPDKVTFEKLLDWSKSDVEGIKYFSGTAQYRRSFAVPAQAVRKGLHQYLDLGDVAVMARVKINGKDLGTLWKTPYRVEVTGALHAGQNRLEILVVNLWPNRMIGDEQLAEDSARNPNGTLKQWPAWLEPGQSSPTGRYTFTSWRLWKKDSALQPSGLLGPVTITVAAEIAD